MFSLGFVCCCSSQYTPQWRSGRHQKMDSPPQNHRTFHFQPAKERFHDAIIIAVTLSGHGLNHTMLRKFVPVKLVLVLPALPAEALYILQILKMPDFPCAIFQNKVHTEYAKGSIGYRAGFCDICFGAL